MEKTNTSTLHNADYTDRFDHIALDAYCHALWLQNSILLVGGHERAVRDQDLTWLIFTTK